MKATQHRNMRAAAGAFGLLESALIGERHGHWLEMGNCPLDAQTEKFVI
jgi:hypothetical protein